MAIIYKITNKVNGKIYVGKSKYNKEEYFGSGIKITNAVKKYGVENFKKEIIVECDNTEADYFETYWIEQLDSRNDDVGYNISAGGTGGDHYWKVMSDKEKEEHRKKIKKGVAGRKRKPHSEETKKKMSKSFNRTPEIQNRIDEKRRKKYIIIDHLEKKVYYTANIKEFCIDHNTPNYGRLQHNERNKKTMVDNRWSCRLESEYYMDNVIEYVEQEVINNQQDYKNKMIMSRKKNKGLL